MQLKAILILTILLISKNLYSQENNREKIFFTSDSLSFIHLFSNQKFGFISYKGDSPLSYYNDKNQIKGHIDGPYFIINEFGSGEYSIQNKKIQLNFIKPKHPIDSISIKESENLTDSIKIKISFKSYVNSKNNDGIGIGSTIKSKDSLININTMFESFTTFGVKKNELPLKLTINEKYDLEIVSDKNHNITLFVNDFKKFTTDNIENKVFELNTLTEQTNE
ncbi:hypothetical protein ACFQZW_09325 [Lutibacter aestuarii]|jgi:hypothetical protein|uniref:Uncharacterized protein n=1 Tax=Lutibacter aestuarii TaxID=861111 RepID=A0ABW2Z661_9FLAO|nr:hypothetical protein [Mesonia sp. HuA40]TXK71212.1 hypothetical protein FT993_11660 [Mesonia sp. HuA40]